jgi:hypothetical protein
MPKSAKNMPIVEFANLEIRSAAERYRTSMAKYFPKPLGTLYRGGRARAVNGFTSSNAAINEIAGHSHERSDLCHWLAAFLNVRPRPGKLGLAQQVSPEDRMSELSRQDEYRGLN